MSNTLNSHPGQIPLFEQILELEPSASLPTFASLCQVMPATPPPTPLAARASKNGNGRADPFLGSPAPINLNQPVHAKRQTKTDQKCCPRFLSHPKIDKGKGGCIVLIIGVSNIS
jgi:hypothetical protein